MRRDDEGYALLTVLGIGIVLLAMVATSLAVSTGGFRKAQTDDNANAALAAAYAGLEEYQSRLANDGRYFMYGNSAAPFSASSAATLTLPSGATTNPAFGVGAAGTWATIPGGTSAYRYEVDNSSYDATGVLHLRVTGRAGDSTRTLVADLKQDGFLDYLYFTDFEIQDPVFSGQTACADLYDWQRSGCTAIQFGAMDVINGPLHSNDKLVICGATFKGAVTTGAPGNTYTKPSGCGSPTWGVGSGPITASTVGMPPTNGELALETRRDLADVPRPGCLYTGPTRITFHANGTMTVISPWTRATNVSFTAGIPSTNPAGCGKPGTGGGQLGSAGGATVPVPDSNVIYVQDVPRTTGDPNYWAAAARPSDFTCIGTSDFPGWRFHGSGYPLDNEVKPDGTNSNNPAYKCDNGDAYVSGTFNGAVTLGAARNVYVTGDLVYADKQNDILGLVATWAVQIWNPKKSDGLIYTDTNRTVQAAILSVAHSFTVQNYKVSPSRGTLTVLGAIAQKYRGPVAQTNSGSLVSGYAKNYVYDTRLRYTAPPKFLTPTSTTYGVTQVASVPAAFNAKGVTR
jgi:type II secretory pathway pseudopilin PulG